MNSHNQYVVILAGGVGKRFWPMSRTKKPKQFIDVLGTGETLIQTTFNRYKQKFDRSQIYIATNAQYIDLIQEQLPDFPLEQLIIEPMIKDTAATVAYAAYTINIKNPEAQMVISPSDHLILDQQTFLTDIETALTESAKNDCLITLGIKPTRPDTNYGYIQYLEKKSVESLYQVKTFTEKPNTELAETFVESGDFLWNSGVFVWSTQSIVAAFEKYQAEMADLFKGLESYIGTEEEEAYINSVFSRCRHISIDTAIMEKADNVYVLPISCGWSDLGTWNSIYNTLEKDESNNVVNNNGKVLLKDCSNSIVYSQKDKIAIIKGLDNYIVVNSNESLLIYPKDQENEIKPLLQEVKDKFELKQL